MRKRQADRPACSSTAPERGLGIEFNVAAFESSLALALFSERSAIVFEVGPERAARQFQAARERSLLAWPAGNVIRTACLRVLFAGEAPIEWVGSKRSSCTRSRVAK